MSQNFLHRQQCIAEGITVFLGNLLNASAMSIAYFFKSVLILVISHPFIF